MLTHNGPTFLPLKSVRQHTTFDAIREMPISRLLFLDFDGVLHPGLAGTFIYLPMLEDYLRAQPSIGVVLSTSWRQQESFPKLLEIFSPDIRSRIVGATPTFPDSPEVRYCEILAWLRANRFSGPWVALDDDTSLFPNFCDNLVVCLTHRGLRPPQLASVSQKLNLPHEG